MSGTRHVDVRMVQDGNMTYPDPPFDPDWSDRTKLEWHAAIAELESGVRIRIADGHFRLMENGRWVEHEPHYSVQVGYSSTVLPFRGAWTYINGARAGGRGAART